MSWKRTRIQSNENENQSRFIFTFYLRNDGDIG